ncbi:UNVERIFIED_ORG: arsenical pump membrane protein [Methylobacterium sp. SuP10 SLI 274]|uniref:arsenic transporter n=1 Tax=Methylorubrum extorquens TaxID=408 RepID=UPI00209F8C9D|nr:arsenic transporter [Methylorubrum extorquens]MDF9863653.1 arsenical pump membrane protein [Methylorubrum pseudosasae]MDH6637254.1 arsenical pump membrane protein [Methylobacterium sp. SuP10 SLI 274]MDH6666434.1 arsenical pump membrane protein [Methylorubrum zatmanii]MCP1558346.1 arsenical pump membrane protein [Methylorubrum extorquens]MDF9791965.1 arsenical pump membrane protein [Methylorubrum extorquens]
MGALIPNPNAATWGIAALATLGVILRPFSWPEAIWAVLGAVLLVLLGLIPWQNALEGAAKGTDVYLFLVGMMLLSEIARKQGLFDWLAAHAVRAAKGSPTRLFSLVYVVGTVVTVFLSNDACAVVLTPAVFAATRAAGVKQPLPYLFVCAFIANAASFVLPISNPANLVVFAEHMPPLGRWLATFTLPSLLAIVATYLVLRLTQNARLKAETVATDVAIPRLGLGGTIAAGGIVATGAALIGASAAGIELGLPTFIAGLATTLVVLAINRGGLVAVARDVSWGVLPLVAGLFVLVESLEKTGLLARLADLLGRAVQGDPAATAWAGGALVAFGSNLVNNLPAGLLAGAAVQAAHVPETVAGAILIGVDLGPNLSVTGSLATILWLTAIRREGQNVSAWAFLKLGALVMPPALALALAALILA